MRARTATRTGRVLARNQRSWHRVADAREHERPDREYLSL